MASRLCSVCGQVWHVVRVCGRMPGAEAPQCIPRTSAHTALYRGAFLPGCLAGSSHKLSAPAKIFSP